MHETFSPRNLIEISSEFYEKNWVVGTSGNFSVVVQENPLLVAITASGVDKGNLVPEQIVLVDANGNPTNTQSLKPSAETLPHLTVIRTTQAKAVLHTHSVWSTIVSSLYIKENEISLEGYEMLKGLAGVTTHEHRELIPMIENSQDMIKFSKEVEKTLARYPEAHAFLVRKHGLYTWGKDLIEARRHAEIVEFLLETIGRLRLAEKI